MVIQFNAVALDRKHDPAIEPLALAPCFHDGFRLGLRLGEALAEALHGLRCQADFRNQHQYLLAGGEMRGHGL